ncbi:MAG: peptidase domain-containing ABC transporter [Bacteroidia bacterium]|nr:peptidase domain-containing ABC transporter [Bacteroidia bacterium]
MFKTRFPHYQQLDMMDCGPSCLKMIAKHYGKDYSTPFLREQSYIDRQGVSLYGISEAAEKIGLHAIPVKATYELLLEEAPLPAIAHWRQNHFVVVYKVRKNQVWVADPATGRVRYSREEFCQYWISNRHQGEDEGVLLLLEPTPAFYQAEQEEKVPSKGWTLIFQYLTPYRKFLIQLFLGLLVGSMIALAFPFLTQAIVDFGINHQDMGFVYTLLIAQLMLFVGKISVDIIRSWILLYVGTRLNITILSDFLRKLMKLPVAFFDSKNLGDILQRIRDHDRIEMFLSATTLEVLFSLFNLLVFSLVLAIYDLRILLVFTLGTVVYIGWLVIFLKKRRNIDYKKFNQLASTQSNEVQLVQGMAEIKLNNCEKQKRWEWERIQAQLFKTNISAMILSQYQSSGALFINELKNIFILFLAAKAVIDGQITLGMMMAITYIVGQLNAPVIQLINFILQAQDAKISLERLQEIHNRPEEDEKQEEAFLIPEQADIRIQKLSFRYNDPGKEWILHDVNLTIPYGKTTAIVGASGSGKTTLLKLFLKFYEPEEGKIMLGKTPLKNLNIRAWRDRCGVVMQDGFIFSDTIARNIALTDEIIDKERLREAVEVANIRTFIEELSLNYNTRIGAEGLSLSQGQKQRLLIARAVYKNPDFFFFDEATSSLDANNEREITEKLQQYTHGKTTVVIAHRLSTVKEADQIVVLNNGKIQEIGTHLELADSKGLYYELVKNQLELGA